MKSKKEEEIKEKKKRKKKEEKSKRYEFIWVFMNYFGYLYRFLWICMEKKKNQTINPFLMNLDLKEPYLVYWLCFGLGLIDCNPQLSNICVKEILRF